MEAKEYTCRFCLAACGDNFEIISEKHKKSFSLLLLNIDLVISHKPIICKSCADNLQKCCLFKTACLFVEDSVTAYANREHNDEVDLRKFYLEGLPCNSNVCRFCMEVIEHGSLRFLNSENLDILLLTTMLEKYFPEMDLTITNQPVICMLCYESLEDYFSVIISCLTIEEKIKRYCEVFGTNSEGIIDLSNVLHFTLQDTLVNKNNELKNLKLENSSHVDGQDKEIETINKKVKIGNENDAEIEERQSHDVLIKNEDVKVEDDSEIIKHNSKPCEEDTGYVILDEEEMKKRQKALDVIRKGVSSHLSKWTTHNPSGPNLGMEKFIPTQLVASPGLPNLPIFRHLGDLFY